MPGCCRKWSPPPEAGGAQVVRDSSTTLIRGRRFARRRAGRAPGTPNVRKTPPAGSTQAAAVRRGGIQEVTLSRDRRQAGAQAFVDREFQRGPGGASRVVSLEATGTRERQAGALRGRPRRR